MRDNPTAQIGLQASDQQKDTIVKSALDPLLVAIHELAGFAFVV